MKKRAGNAAFAGLKAKLRALPVSLSHKVAQQVGPALSAATNTAYEHGRTVYGESRPKGVDGNALDLVDSGDTKSSTTYQVDGRIVRVGLGTKWAKYLIGKYRILPNGALPVQWKRDIDAILHKTKAGL